MRKFVKLLTVRKNYSFRRRSLYRQASDGEKALSNRVLVCEQSVSSL